MARFVVSRSQRLPVIIITQKKHTVAEMTLETGGGLSRTNVAELYLLVSASETTGETQHDMVENGPHIHMI